MGNEYDSTVGRAPAFRGDLQGLRAIAVLLVVLAHAGLPQLEGGFVGVDVFFVLSGYLITGILVRELDSSSKVQLLRFYARRLRRLLPALLVMLAVSFAAASLLLSPSEASGQLASSPYAASWTSNLFFAFRSVDYFDELAAKDLFLHTWSLGVEEQFYLIWPAYLFLLYALGKRFLQGGRLVLLPGLMVAFVVSLGLSLYWTDNNPELAFYMMPSRIWQLSLGAIIFLLPGYPRGVGGPEGAGQSIPASILLCTGLMLVVGSALVFDNQQVYPGFSALFPAAGAALVIRAGMSGAARQWTPLNHPILGWFGDRSYSIYLWHWPVLILGSALGLVETPAAVLGFVLLGLLLAMLSYELVEQPFWRGRWSGGRAVPVTLTCIAAIVATVAVSVEGLKVFSQMPQPIEISNTVRSDMPEIYSINCDAWYQNADVQPCLFGDEDAPRTAVVIGDSIGLQWFSVFPAIFPVPSWRVIVLTKSSCPMVDEPFFYSRIGREYKVCETWRNQVIDQVTSVQPDVVVLGSAATYPFTKTQWHAGSERVFERFKAMAGAVLVIPGTPQLGFDGPGCLQRNLSKQGTINPDSCIGRDKAAAVESVAGFLESAASPYANVKVLNLNELVCPEGDCPALSPSGVPVFRDGQHLTDSFVRQLAPKVKEQILALYPNLLE